MIHHSEAYIITVMNNLYKVMKACKCTINLNALSSNEFVASFSRQITVYSEADDKLTEPEGRGDSIEAALKDLDNKLTNKVIMSTNPAHLRAEKYAGPLVDIDIVLEEADSELLSTEKDFIVHTKNKNIKGIKRLLANGFDINKPIEDFTPLMYAARLHNKDEVLIQMLMELGADINTKTKSKHIGNGLTLITFDYLINGGGLTSFLLQNGADVDTKWVGPAGTASFKEILSCTGTGEEKLIYRRELAKIRKSKLLVNKQKDPAGQINSEVEFI